MIFRVFHSIVFVFVVTGSWAQTALTATEAVFKALENNYQIQIATKRQEVAERNNSWTGAGAFPSVQLSVTNNNTIQDNTNNPFTFTPGIILSQSLNPSLSANWNIFTGFAVRINKTRLEQLEEQSAQNAMTLIESTVQDVLKAYYTAQLQSEREKLLQSLLELSRERFNYYQIKEKYSSSSSLELLQFRNQYLTDSMNYLMQGISVNNAYRNLKLLMNDTSDLVYVLTDPLEASIAEVDLSNAKEQVFVNNANLKSQYIALELQKSNTSLQRSFLYPTLSFQAGVNPNWSWIREVKDDLFDVEARSLSYYGNFNLRYTLFDNWKNKRAVEVSRIQEEISLLQVQEMKYSLERTLENLIELLTIRTQMLALSTENLEYAQKAFELAQRKFELGAINSVELMTFRNTYQNTVIQHLENQFNRLDTFLEIYKITGKISLAYTN